MGAMARQVLQVKRKNSTNCSPPDARLTVVGSVAWRSGPREVATGRAVASSGGAVWVSGSSVAARVSVARTSVTGAGESVTELSGAHAANRVTIRLRVRRARFFLIVLMKCYSIESLHRD